MSADDNEHYRRRTHIAAEAGAEHDTREKQQIDLLLQFFSSTRNYCVGMVDMVGSTAATMKMAPEKVSRFYSIFLNGLAEVVSRNGAVVVKNIGDSLLYYFPATESGDALSFKQVLRCCFAMIEKGPQLNALLAREGLPEIKYRISCEYGAVVVARMSTSSVNDIFGSPVNMCSKMNPYAPPGGVVIGQGLYEMTKGFSGYAFSEVKDAPVFSESGYSLYIVSLSTTTIEGSPEK
ncbi:MAG TPA: adenylate/guanylate cyclase domain-containing protein [Nitrososphaera sp.]|nr:adenylate/guanylate cyclase domain-containing protein [Nitrososphaera sp.]